MATAKTTLPRSLEIPLSIMLIVGGIIGLISSFVLTWDKMEFLKNPQFHPNCNLNPVISCGNVMTSNQGSAFGFPNPWIGLAGFSVLVTIGVAILAGAKFKRWFWLGLEAGIIAGLVFAFWLLFESVYRINALCPYCLAVDIVVVTLFWYTTLYLVEQKFIPLKGKMLAAAGFARRHHLDILVGVFVILIAIILKHFWYYYGQHL
jgi:uncharacterized membrane protein